MKRTAIALGLLIASVADNTLGAAEALRDDHVFVIRVQARQATTTAPITLIFEELFWEGKRQMVRTSQAVIAPSDVNESLTLQAQELDRSPGRGRLFVLNVTKRNTQVTTSTPWVFTLASGVEITVPPSAVQDVLTHQVRALVRARGSGSSPTASSGSEANAGEANATEMIRVKCTKDWPDDFSVRKFCMNQQHAALKKLQERSMSADADHRTIRAKCAKDWPDDFGVRNFCEEQQLKALASIR